MKLSISPETFNYIAITLARFKWALMSWSAFLFVLFLLLQSQITFSTPNALVWLAIFILFIAIESLVACAFIFFFQILPSTKEQSAQWVSFYRAIEWCETLLFTVLIPLPVILYIYAFIHLNSL